MGKTIYTLWKSDINNTEEALLLDSEPIFRTKHRAFKRAHSLASKLAKGWDQVILVRKITFGSDLCTEWEFEAE